MIYSALWRGRIFADTLALPDILLQKILQFNSNLAKLQHVCGQRKLVKLRYEYCS